MSNLIDESLLTEAEVAALLGCKITTLRTQASRRRGPPRLKLGKRVLYRREAVMEWVRRQEIDPEAARRRVAGEGR